MAIEGKRKVSFYVNEENLNVLRNYLDSRPGAGGVSELVDKHIARCADTIRKNPDKLAKIKPGKLTLKKFFQLASLDVDPRSHVDDL
jgi:hypothetical protein